MLHKLREAGCYQINLGVESGSQQILDAMQKRICVRQIREASKMIRDAGIELGYFIMFGYPGETFTDIRQTEQLLFQTKPDHVGYSIAYPVPGTEFYESVKDRLSTDIDTLWERTMHGLQLLFQAQYPLSYYRSLVCYLESRQRYHYGRWPSFSKLTWLVSMILAGLARWIMERLWPLIRKIHHRKEKGVYCSES
jgi:radical SAM superfamily enzyme YgiQ (UPF0313 family)